MEKQSNWVHKHPILTTVIVIFALSLIVGVFRSDRESSPRSQTIPSVQGNSQEVVSSSTATWHEIVNFTGVGVKNTDSFAIRGSKFKLVYTVVPDNAYSIFTFFVYPEGENIYEEYVSLDSGTDETISFAGPGSYYLTVNAGNVRSWKISVYDYY